VEYRRMALATVNTHDLPPLIGWMEGRDIMLRSELGDLSDPVQQNNMREMRWIERTALVESLIDEGILPESARENVTSDDLIAGVHTFIRRTPSALVGLSLDDLAHETTPVNIPGVWQDRYPSWSRRMRETIEALLANPRTERALGV
jgi:4-alpha-glucanotransferase